MDSTIDSIFIKNTLWARLKDYMTSFRSNEMQKDVHFSIAYNETSPDINFHITRNAGNPNTKPRIEIVRINKKELEELLPQLFMSMLGFILQPIVLRSFGRHTRHHYGIQFYPLNEEETEDDILKKKITTEFKSISKIKKKQLVINSDIETYVKNITIDGILLNTFQKKLRWLPTESSKQLFTAFLISKNYTGCAIRIDNRWYSFRENIMLIDFLKVLMGNDLAKHLAFKTMMAYARIRELNNFSESEKYNHSLRLHKIIEQ